MKKPLEIQLIKNISYLKVILDLLTRMQNDGNKSISKKYIVLCVLALLSTILYGQNQKNESIDPNTVAESIAEMREEPEINADSEPIKLMYYSGETPCKFPLSGICHKFILNGFSSSGKLAYEHPGTSDFLKEIIQFIQTKDRKYGSIQWLSSIEFHGYADGLPNPGIEGWANLDFSDCQEQKTGKISDPQLAKLRACLLYEELTNIYLDNSYTFITATTKHTDIPSGGDFGDLIRRVEVLLIEDIP
ncbi:MAG: hypothetical protein QNK37_04215 [Acidobacteriota bacterium]|nr:hypothetical protein [Acidobacteriota bacterium]